MTNETPINGAAHPAAEALGEPYSVLGYAGSDDQLRYYFLNDSTQRVMSFTAQALLSMNGPLALVPNAAFWGERFPPGRRGIPWGEVGTRLISECYEAGYFDVERVRARGVWMDKGRVIAHLGDEVWCNSEIITPIAMTEQSSYIYPAQQCLIRTDGEDDWGEEMSDAEGQAFLNLARRPSWVRKSSGDLLAGLIATSHICGALKFRTHGWITGASFTGKSWVMEEVVKRGLGSIGLYIAGSSTEAGIRQTLGHDARPVVFDEAEGGEGGHARRKAIIELMRASSSAAGAHVVKGTVGHKATRFTMRSQFILASIGVGLEAIADETRCLVLTLKNPLENATKSDVSLAFLDMQIMARKFDSGFALRLFRRMVRLVPVIRKNAEKFRRAIADIKDSRTGEQVGTVLAGVAALTCQHELSEAEIAERIKDFQWKDYTPPENHGDEEDIVTVLASHQVMVRDDTGTNVRRALGELIEVARGRDNIQRVSPLEADLTLKRHGIRVGPKDWDEAYRRPQDWTETGVWIANKHPELKRIMERSSYPVGWDRILARVRGAVRSDNSHRFAGIKARATWVPLATFTDPVTYNITSGSELDLWPEP